MPGPVRDWNQRYADGDTPWDSGQPSLELQRVLNEHDIAPCRMLELGCGSGTNSVYLCQRGFDVTAIDISPLAIARAKDRGDAEGVNIDFRAVDLLKQPDLGGPFPFVFDRGLYHVLRRESLDAFRQALGGVAAPGGLYLTLAGNANDPVEMDEGPPQVSAVELCTELEPLFHVVALREFHFDGVQIQGQAVRPLAWSALLRRHNSPAK